MRIRAIGGLLAVALLLPTLAPAQVGPKIGTIPGTEMTRDEFRARAEAQLSAIALNAAAYRQVHGSYAPDLATLQASPAWVLRVRNMFRPRNVQSIWFEPRTEHMTSSIPTPLGGVDAHPPPPPPPSAGPRPPGETPPIVMVPSGTGRTRVDPKAIRDFEAGDVFYFTGGDLMQLVLYAPDGTYYEWIDEVPESRFRDQLMVPQGAPTDHIFAAAVLYFVERQSPKYHNLVQFMGDRPTLPGASLNDLPADKRVELAERLGITVTNPFTRREIEIVTECSPGNLLASASSPIMLCTDEGPLTLAQLTRPGVAPQERPVQAQPRPTRPAPGGGRTPGAPGGGRQPR